MLIAIDASASLVDRVLDGVLRWLTHHLPLFDPFANGEEDTRPRPWQDCVFAQTCAVHSVSLERLQSLAGLGVFAMVHETRRPRGDPRVGRIVSFLADLFSRPALYERIERDPQAFAAYLKIHGALERCGRGTREVRALLQRFIARGYPGAYESTVAHQLELRYWLDLGGYRHGLPSAARIYRHSAVGRAAEATNVFVADPTAIARSLCVLTAYGTERPAVVPRRHLPSIRWAIRMHLGISVLQRRWDTTAELLSSSRCLRMPPSVVSANAWRALSVAQRPDGAFDGSDSPPTGLAVPAPAGAKHDFNRHHQTTLAVGLAAC